jgi:tRNA A37 threonylcarbamoyladenosine dehydratase
MEKDLDNDLKDSNSIKERLVTLKKRVSHEAFENLKKFSLHSPDAYWAAAFTRHKGYFSNTEQDRLRYTTVAIAGLGAVGGTVFLGLVRSGIGSFVLAEFDHFETSNLNRQNGARADTLGQSKIETLVEEALRINPFLKIKTFSDGLKLSNVDAFLDGVDVVVDAMDFFAYRERLSLLIACREKDLFVVSSGNVGFGASLLIFDPQGMDVEAFLGVSLKSSDQDVMAAFALSWIPHQFSRKYTDPSYISLEAKVGPATGVASLLAGSMIITETLRIALQQLGIKPIPHFIQFDFHEGKYTEGVLRRGNKSLWQRIRRYVLINKYWGKKQGFKPVSPPGLPQKKVTSLPVPEAVVRAILTAGIQAPSGDNTQPWVFRLVGEKIHLELEMKNNPSYFDYKQIPAFVSAGAVIENIRISATFYGLETVIETLEYRKFLGDKLTPF